MGKERKGYRLQQVLDGLFPVFIAKGPMKGKRERHAPTSSTQALVYLRSVSETLQSKKFHGIFTLSAGSRRMCLNLTVLWDEVGGGGEEGGKREKDRKIRD